MEPQKVDLPGGRLYTDTCYVETFGADDVASIYNLVSKEDPSVLIEIMNRKINLEASDLATYDYEFLLWWQRVNSYPMTPHKINWDCPYCDLRNDTVVTTGMLESKDIDEDYDHGDMGLDIYSREDPLYIRLQLVGDTPKARNFLRETYEVSTPNPGQFRKALISCMTEPSGGTLKERYVDLFSGENKLTADDYYLIESFEKDFSYGVPDSSMITCNNKRCRRESRVAFSLDLAHFFPSTLDSRNVRARVRSRKRAKLENPGHGLREGSLDVQEISTGDRGTQDNEATTSQKEQIETIVEVDRSIKTPNELNK